MGQTNKQWPTHTLSKGFWNQWEQFIPNPFKVPIVISPNHNDLVLKHLYVSFLQNNKLVHHCLLQQNRAGICVSLSASGWPGINCHCSLPPQPTPPTHPKKTVNLFLQLDKNIHMNVSLWTSSPEIIHFNLMLLFTSVKDLAVCKYTATRLVTYWYCKPTQLQRIISGLKQQQQQNSAVS